MSQDEHKEIFRSLRIVSALLILIIITSIIIDRNYDEIRGGDLNESNQTNNRINGEVAKILMFY
jgi:hypothetical protein